MEQRTGNPKPKCTCGGDRLLDVRQLQSLAETLAEFQLVLKRVITSRRQTAIAAVTAGYSVDQDSSVESLVQSPPSPGRPLADPIYLQTTVRSGVDIQHPGTIVILGDTNPGSALIAEGDIIVWGRLRGMAHAGASGNRDRRIMALQMQPTQLRIADLVARPPMLPRQNIGQRWPTPTAMPFALPAPKTLPAPSSAPAG